MYVRERSGHDMTREMDIVDFHGAAGDPCYRGWERIDTFGQADGGEDVDWTSFGIEAAGCLIAADGDLQRGFPCLLESFMGVLGSTDGGFAILTAMVESASWREFLDLAAADKIPRAGRAAIAVAIQGALPRVQWRHIREYARRKWTEAMNDRIVSTEPTEGMLPPEQGGGILVQVEGGEKMRYCPKNPPCESDGRTVECPTGVQPVDQPCPAGYGGMPGAPANGDMVTTRTPRRLQRRPGFVIDQLTPGVPKTADEAWYKNPWVWGIAGVVVVGGVAAWFLLK
jgi:hypothetical protein